MGYKIKVILNENNNQTAYAEGTCVITDSYYKTDFFSLKGYHAWRRGLLIQNALPEISANDREFLISGISPVTFDSIFDDDDS